MKRIFVLTLLSLLMASLLLGCAQASATGETTPETAPSAKAPVAYDAPATFTGDWTGLEDTFQVHADAQVLLPDLNALTTAKVAARSFSQEEADKMMAVFLKGNTLYEEPVFTKSDYARELAHYEAIQRGEIPYEHDGTIDRVPGIIEGLKKAMETAPNDGERFTADPNFHKREYPEGTRNLGEPKSHQVINGYAEVDGRNIHCGFSRIENPTEGFHYCYAKFWEEGYGDINGPQCSQALSNLFAPEEGTAIVPEMTEAQAKKVGGQRMEELGLGDFSLDVIRPVTCGDYEVMEENERQAIYQFAPNGQTGYMLLYVRQVNGLPLTRTTGDGSSHEENTPDIGCWADERVMMVVSGDRVVWFEWSNPYTEPEILTDSVSLVPFSNIREVFAKMIFVKNHYWLEAGKADGIRTLHNINVDKVQLTLMRTRPKDSLSEGTIIPVWDFWGTTTAKAADEAYKDLVYTGGHYEVVLSINALDGTVVDRALGY